MKEKQLGILKSELGLEFSKEVCKKINAWERLFLDYNSHTNLMSKGDLSFLFEKHIFDSLAICKYKNFDRIAGGKMAGDALKILDVGTGGGFPGLILAVCFENIDVTAVDSISKKINFIDLAVRELGLKNIKPICGRVENLVPQNVDIITSRAVGKMAEIYKNSQQHLKLGGKFIFYKADPKVYEGEIKELQACAGKKISPEIINYELHTQEKHKRTLVVI